MLLGELAHEHGFCGATDEGFLELARGEPVLDLKAIGDHVLDAEVPSQRHHREVEGTRNDDLLAAGALRLLDQVQGSRKDLWLDDFFEQLFCENLQPIEREPSVVVVEDFVKPLARYFVGRNKKRHTHRGLNRRAQ